MATPLIWNPQFHWNDPALTWNGFAPAPINTMPNDNRISAIIAAADKTAFLAKVGEAGALLPFAINLTPTERRRIVSIGLERAGMLDDFSLAMTAHPTLVPSFVNMTEMNKDLALYRDLMPLAAASMELCEKLDDTMKAVSADLFVAFTAFYASVKEARRRNVPGSDAVYDVLAPYFARNTPPPSPTP
jgi:hypothetical protein